jgi:hypothetical protein
MSTASVRLPRFHHDNPWRKAQRINSLTEIRQRHLARRNTWPEHSVHHYPPTVDVSNKYSMFKFDAPRLAWAIINPVGENYFKSVGDEENEMSLRYYASELAATWSNAKEAEELLAVIDGDSDVKHGQNLNKIFESGVRFWGHHLVKFAKKEKKRGGLAVPKRLT